MANDDEYVTIQQAMQIAQVKSRRTIYSWIATGKMDVVRTPGGGIRIRASTLFRRVRQSGAEVASTLVNRLNP